MNSLGRSIVAVFKWMKALTFIILALPFLLIGAVSVATALLGVLVGCIGLGLLFLAGVVKIDVEGIKKGIEDIINKAK